MIGASVGFCSACSQQVSRTDVSLLDDSESVVVQRNQLLMLVKQVDLKNCTIRLLAGFTKNNEGRVVRMTEEVYTLWQPCVEGKKTDDPLFTWEDGS